VGTVVAGGPCAKALRPGDVLLAIDDHPIASDASVELEANAWRCLKWWKRKFKGEKVKLDIWRGQATTECKRPA